MNTISNSYTASMPYEQFMKRAFGRNRTETKLSNAIMQNLIGAENGKEYNFLPKREKQFFVTKKYIGQALEKFAKMNLTETVKIEVSNCIELLPMCRNSNELLNIVHRVLELTHL